MSEHDRNVANMGVDMAVLVKIVNHSTVLVDMAFRRLLLGFEKFIDHWICLCI